MQIALLRGINVGGHNKIVMSDLRELFDDLGLTEVTTLLQSGNLVFQSGRQNDAALERLLEKETARHLGVSVDFIIRSAREWAKILDRNPFPKEAKGDPSHLVVMFLKTAPSPESVETLRLSVKGPELIHHDGKHLYITYPSGIGRSKLTGALIEKKLGSRGTARNWSTILKLSALCG